MTKTEGVKMELNPVERLAKDVKQASSTLSEHEVRFLVDTYYAMQEDRKRANNQVRALSESGEPHEVIGWLAKQSTSLENQIKMSLDVYSDNHPVGEWMRSQKGIGPVIAAGLLAHIDINKAPTAGHIWRYAGQDPTVKWKSRKFCDEWVKTNGTDLGLAANYFGRNLDTLTKMVTTDKDGKKVEVSATRLSAALARMPWNSDLKTLCWKIGESFVKVSGKEDAFYGQLYVQRKQYENEKNQAGEYAAQAARALEEKNYGKSTEAYKHYSSGKLPPAHIQARAKRYAVKIFLSHLHHVWFLWHFEEQPPKPFAIEHLGHAHNLVPPNLDIIQEIIGSK